MNVKLIKVHEYYLNIDFYINLNFIASIFPELDNSTLVTLFDGSRYRINQSFDDFIDYLVELSGLLNGGEEG